MKTLSIQKTIYPNVDKPVYWDGCRMPEHKYYAMDSELFNRWSVHIHNQLLKCRMWNNIIERIKVAHMRHTNVVKKGGVAHIDGQESFLKQMKEVIHG
jgi:hypothetical protein